MDHIQVIIVGTDQTKEAADTLKRAGTKNISLPDNNEVREKFLQALSIAKIPADIVVNADGSIALVGEGPDSLRAAWRFIKYGDRLQEGLQSEQK